MMSRHAAVVLAFLMGQAMPAEAAAPKGKASPRCMAAASTLWDPPGPARFTVEARADGPRCAQAVAVLVIRGPRGEVLHHRSYQTAMVLPLSDARAAPEMQAALRLWIARGGESFASTRDLPVWQAGQEAPAGGEFPFYPEDGITRADWAALRARARPVFCYVQGMESQKCLEAAPDGFLNAIGVQSLPG